MRYIKRSISSVIERDLRGYPVITLTGPRQSGKTTLLKSLLPDWTYVSLVDADKREYATTDPKGFLLNLGRRVIIDEIHRVPELMSQIQVEVDRDRRPGMYALTGSHNLLLMESASQTLAGRTSIRHLFPFSYHELSQEGIASDSLDTELFRGGYPRMHEPEIVPDEWMGNYIQTYVERDVREIRNILDLGTFRRFIKLCAGRAGQLIDLSGVGNDCGVSYNTIRDWINLLEVSFIAFRLQPYYRNFSKRLMKTPKLYFHDTGLLCRLLDIKNVSDIVYHPMRGAIFENWCISEVMKSAYHHGKTPSIYFWRDQQIEVDLIIERAFEQFDAIELKSSKTIISDFIQSSLKLKSFAKATVTPSVVHGGDTTQHRTDGIFWSWKDFSTHLNAPEPL